MVVRMLAILAVLSGLSVPLMAAGDESSFRLVVTTGQAEYGKAIEAELFAHNALPDLRALDMTVLEQEFVVDTTANIEHDSNTGYQHWRVRLFPRRPGVLWIRSLVFHGHKTAPVRLQVGPALDRKDKAGIQVNSIVGAREVWVTQAVRISLQIESHSRYASLHTESVQHADLDIHLLPYVREAITPDGAQRTRHRIGWVLHPQAPGPLTLQLPPVEYQRDGVTTHRFYPPKLHLKVRPLPAFVPPTMPVGKIGLEVRLPERLFLGKRELAFLTLRFTSEGSPGRHAAGILRQFRSNQDLTFYAPRELDSGEGGDIFLGGPGTYQVPFAAKTMGLIELPPLRLQYFDPVTGKIATGTYSPGKVLSITPWVQYAGLVIAVLALYWLAKILFHWLRQRYRSWQSYRSALIRLRRAESPQAIKAALMDMAIAEGWPGNLTLATWQQRWTTQYPQLSSISGNILRLQARLYGQNEDNLDEIRCNLIDVCYWRIPLLKLRRNRRYT